ncbi:MAG: ADP-ribose pyrophosphatase [Candidatus Aenigmatarchaeota archaeon]|nr:MAG: ADP-ribose pyrophosphatase [Candidatus Aenigmarchaeota archaeon]
MSHPRVGVGVLLLNDGNVLLGQRHEDPEKADSELHGEGTWTLPGGKLDFHEGIRECAAREVLEETGIKLGSTRVISVSNDTVPDKHFVTIGFLCEDFEGEPKVMEPDEITRWEWFPLDSLPEPIFPPSLKMIENYKNKTLLSE